MYLNDVNPRLSKWALEPGGTGDLFPDAFLPPGPGPAIRANGGTIVWSGDHWVFQLGVMDIKRVAARLGHGCPFAMAYPAEPLWCNPTPPILPSLGGFYHPATGAYCAPKGIPKHVDQAWQGWGDGCPHPQRDFECGPGPAPIRKDKSPVRADRPLNLAPPWWVEFAGPKTGDCCWHAGPFAEHDEAVHFAAKTAGFRAAPLDGWVQTFDSRGRLAMVT